MASTIEVDKIKHSSGVAFTLPTADGTAGQLLKTDGSRGLGWVTDAHTTYSVQDGELSENNFTNADHTKLDGIETSATADQTNAEIKTAVEAATSIALGGSPTTTTQSGSDNSTKIATTAYTDAQVATVVDSAPGTLNTLNELAAALGDDANFSTTTATNIAAKLPLAGGAMTGAITTNSTFDGRDVATDGTKLDGIEASATADQTKTDIEALGIALPAANLTGTVANARLGTVSVGKGGTGATTHTANSVLVGNGTSAVGSIAPSTSGYILTSNGTSWASTAPSTSGIGLLDEANTWTKGQRGEITALTYGSTITPDLNHSNHFSFTLTGNSTLANPSNLTAGQTGSIFITQDGTGNRILSFGTYWMWSGGGAPDLSTDGGLVDRLDYIVVSTTSIHGVLSLEIKV